MSADMRNTNLLPVKYGFGSRCVRQARLLGNRQSIHVRAERHDRPRQSPFQNTNDSGMSYRITHFQTKCPQMIRNQFPGSEFPIAKLGMLMNVSPPGNRLRFNLLGQRLDFGT